ncbi:FMN-dependent NADH-azoreductase [Actinacidiphila sp. ITFR-21]|uniref:FMN-dependent NADH-azoreductase n=1 Tax=Actinacidiphila sp. ITFR-21 TaxID=3075199 RepID=UPI002889FD71|nr:NAD(P)H-dependent oxidoreductase [Streptomyces sp. ITFR-21]WNI16697.1 NAD(P)H-dependent oxidoreductase [Streptomyces sp. ITFR-21]
MATLLHIDSSAFYETSVSREVTAIFRKEWESQHPDGTVIYRDLAKDPLPHLDAHAIASAFAPAESHTPEQAAGAALRAELADELERADAILIGTPMYNFTIPSTLKAWLDQVIISGRTSGESPSAAGKPTTVVVARGGGYGPGTPRESFEFVATYLEKVLTGLLGLDVDFIIPELTLARQVPAMADLVELADASRTKAQADAAAKAKTLAARFVVA